MEIVISKESKTPAYQQIADAFKGQILEGALRPGDLLPPARELATELGLSTPTITRAYSQLDDAGLTFTHHGKGTFVCASSTTSTSDRNTTNMGKNIVFFSYAHSDEEASCGAISKFRDALAREYKLQTGEPLSIFFDKDSIEWGSNWRDAIQQNIGATFVFMPFLSPSFLSSTSCMNEFRSAQLAFEERELTQGICPLMFVDCADRIRDLTDDSLANSLLCDQWRDISELQYEDPSSSDYRRAVRGIVKEVRAITTTINTELFSSTQKTIPTDEEENPIDGFVEAMAGMEESASEATETINHFGNIIQLIGETTAPYTAKLEEAKTFKDKLLILRQYSADLSPYAEESKSIAGEINIQVRNVDRCVGTILDCIPSLINLSDGGNKQDVISFCNSLLKLQQDAEVGFEGAESFRNQIGPLSKLSRELKNPLNTLRDALDLFLSNRSTFLQWRDASSHILEEIQPGDSQPSEA